MKLKLLITLVLFLTYSRAGSITVAVAANVSYAINDLTEAFNVRYPDTKVKVTLGSSGKLTAQIKHGAPYDLFMAADMKYPQALYEEGVAVTKPVIYAQGGLAYLSSKKQDFTQGISLLSSQKIDKIAIANPKTAPYGKAALEAMRNGGVLKGVEKKLVYAETISQTVSYAMTAADIGFIAKSSLYSPTMSHFKEGVHWADVDTTLYTPIDQGIVVLKEGKEKSEVLAFYDFIQSDEAKKIFRSFGYLVR
jgi:molybdate transport system substrate-binding protein